ncbi:MAG: hypothetical protein P8L20_08760 [Flavobacteriales bacterium]|nr:hypothetical protein [Flavobacteriales bacterium]
MKNTKENLYEMLASELSGLKNDLLLAKLYLLLDETDDQSLTLDASLIKSWKADTL